MKNFKLTKVKNEKGKTQSIKLNISLPNYMWILIVIALISLVVWGVIKLF